MTHILKGDRVMISKHMLQLLCCVLLVCPAAARPDVTAAARVFYQQDSRTYIAQLAYPLPKLIKGTNGTDYAINSLNVSPFYVGGSTDEANTIPEGSQDGSQIQQVGVGFDLDIALNPGYGFRVLAEYLPAESERLVMGGLFRVKGEKTLAVASEFYYGQKTQVSLGLKMSSHDSIINRGPLTEALSEAVTATNGDDAAEVLASNPATISGLSSWFGVLGISVPLSDIFQVYSEFGLGLKKRITLGNFDSGTKVYSQIEEDFSTYLARRSTYGRVGIKLYKPARS